jgi:hypothetical protein
MKGKFDSVRFDEPIINVEIGWHTIFALIPHRTISGRWVWMKQCYKRIVWRGMYGFHIEPFTEYGELFDILAEDHGHE